MSPRPERSAKPSAPSCLPCWPGKQENVEAPRGKIVPGGASNGSACRSDAAAQALERLGEDRLAIGVAAPLLHVRQVRLVGLSARRRWRVRLVPAGREAAARALPLVRDGGVSRKAWLGLMTVRAPEGDPDSRGCLATLRLPHGASAHPATAYRIATAHRPLLAADN